MSNEPRSTFAPQGPADKPVHGDKLGRVAPEADAPSSDPATAEEQRRTPPDPTPERGTSDGGTGDMDQPGMDPDIERMAD
jgi:hypothetical protein